MKIYHLAAVTVLAGSIAMCAGSRTLALQKDANRGGEGGGGGSHSSGGGGGQSHAAPSRPPAPAPSRPAPSRPAPSPGPPVHAQREAVRTPNFVTRTIGGGASRQPAPTEHVTPIRSNTFQPGPAPARRRIEPTALNHTKCTKIYKNGVGASI